MRRRDVGTGPGQPTVGHEPAGRGPGPGHAHPAGRRRLLNGQGYCHGGYLATLADTAFAFACNTGNEVTVAAGFDIVFVRPAREGDVVRASAVERARFGRSGLYDVTITRSGGELIAEFRGRSRSLGRPLLPGHPGPGRPAG